MNGALDLSSAELKFRMGSDREPTEVVGKEEVEMQSVVAEMMIAANASVAQRIHTAFPSHALLRTHAQPRMEGLKAIMECCKAKGVTVDASSNASLSASLHRLKECSDHAVQRAVSALVTRAMAEAEYASSGQTTSESMGHYGLAMGLYTHFTSPIRRYADVVVHRLLMAAVEGGEGVTRREVEEVSSMMNARHRASKAAQQDCSHLYLLNFLTTHKVVQRGVVMSVGEEAVSLLLPAYNLRGNVQLKDKEGHVMMPAVEDGEVGERREGAVAEVVGGGVEVREGKGGSLLLRLQPLDSVWVDVSAEGERGAGRS